MNEKQSEALRYLTTRKTFEEILQRHLDNKGWKDSTSEECKLIMSSVCAEFNISVVFSGSDVFTSLAEFGHYSLYVYFTNESIIFRVNETLTFSKKEFIRLPYSDEKCLDYGYIESIVLDFYAWVIEMRSAQKDFSVFLEKLDSLL